MGWMMLAFFAATSCIAWLLLFMGFQTRRESRQRCETEHTRAAGVIVDYVRRERPVGRSSRVYWRPVVEFTADGRKQRAEYENSMDQGRFPVGSAVEVLYDVSDPSRFHLEQDPVFADPGSGAIRISAIWILASAALTVLLAVFVGGLRIDLGAGLRRLGLRLRR